MTIFLPRISVNVMDGRPFYDYRPLVDEVRTMWGHVDLGDNQCWTEGLPSVSAAQAVMTALGGRYSPRLLVGHAYIGLKDRYYWARLKNGPTWALLYWQGVPLPELVALLKQRKGEGGKPEFGAAVLG